MYKSVIEQLKAELEELERQRSELNKKKEERYKVLDVLQKLQGEEERKKSNLATQKGVCPFPDSCSKADVCTLDRCNADVCSNGYAYRHS